MRRYWFGEWVEGPEHLGVSDVKALLQAAERSRAEMRDYPADRALAVLGEMSRRWADPTYGPRARAEAELPALTGFSPEMISLAMQELRWTLDPEVLGRKVATELGGWLRHGEVRLDPRSGTRLSWEPIGVLLQVLSGNVFLVGIGSFVEGVLTGNVSILKLASAETKFMPWFCESLRECDPDGVLSRSVALVDYAWDQHDVIAALKQGVDGVVVWGGEQAVRAYRDGLPARTRLVVFGPKLSAALVTREGLRHTGVPETARRLAREMSIWDQNACTAPQLCFVEGEEGARELFGTLAAECESQRLTLPPGPADVHTAVEIQKLRGVLEVAAARGEGDLRASAGSVDWTVGLDPRARLAPSPLHRTISLVPITDWRGMLSECRAVRGYLQTVGVVAAPAEAASVAEALAAEGALRVLELGSMSGGEVDDPHDGAYDLPQLVHQVVTRVPCGPRAARHFETLSAERQAGMLDARLRTLLTHARRAPYYAEALRGMRIDGVGDLPKAPVLTRQLMEAGLPPRGRGLETGEYRGGYVTRSGGSTGEPKFSFYDGADWECLVAHGAEMFRSMGLSDRDRIANCMLAGDLYGSFVSFDHINCRLGAATLAFAGKAEPALFARMWREIGITAVQGIPATLMPLLRAAKEIERSLSIPRIVYAGCPLQVSDREWLRAELKPERIVSVIGANDGGQLAYQCEHQQGAVHHVVDDFNYLEIVDSGGQRVRGGEPGEILVTSLLKRGFPLIRYAVGDRGRWLPPCDCGRRGRVMEYLGRADDSICVGLLNVCHRDFLAALDGMPVSLLQLVVSRSAGPGERIKARVETSDADAAWGPRARALFLEHVRKLAESLDAGTLAALEVEIVGPGGLPRNPRTGKVSSVVDERD